MAVLQRPVAPPASGRCAAARPPLCHRPPRPPPVSRWKRSGKRSNSPRRPSAAASAGNGGGGGAGGPSVEEPDPLLLAALRAAWLRDQESRRPDPLFIDPYAAGLLSLHTPHEAIKNSLASHSLAYASRYLVASKFFDDKLQNWVNSSDEFRQIVLLSDGMDTRAYRLNWPRLSVIYDVSPGRVFSVAAQQLKGVGAKLSRNCILFHSPSESPDLQQVLCKNGFNGNRPSLWVLQGFPLFSPTSLENLLLVISNLAMKGSLFIGELPHFPEWTTSVNMVLKQDWLEKLFLTQGFKVSFIHYENVAKDICLDLLPQLGYYGGVIFVAEQLRFSDAQMESFRMHFQRIEEDADEEGFEEL